MSRKPPSVVAKPKVPAGRDRLEQGFLVTFMNRRGDTRTMRGYGMPSLSELCDAALAIDKTHRVVAISTPQTIEADLAGRRRVITGANVTQNNPEASMLGKVGRIAMLHPLISGRSRGASK